MKTDYQLLKFINGIQKTTKLIGLINEENAKFRKQDTHLNIFYELKSFLNCPRFNIN